MNGEDHDKIIELSTDMKHVKKTVDCLDKKLDRLTLSVVKWSVSIASLSTGAIITVMKLIEKFA